MKINKLVFKTLTLYFSIFFVLYTALYLLMPFSINGLVILFNILPSSIIFLVSCIFILIIANKKTKTNEECDVIFTICKNLPISLHLITILVSTIMFVLNRDNVIICLITMFGGSVFYIFSQAFFKSILQYSENNFRKKTEDLIDSNTISRDIPESINLVFEILPLLLINLLIGRHFNLSSIGSVIFVIATMIISGLSLIKVSINLFSNLDNAFNGKVIDNNELGSIAYKVNADKEVLVKQQEEELEKERLSSIEIMRRTVDAKDTYTRGHSDRVAEYSVLIGEKLGLSEEDLDLLKVGGLFHDIGKIGVPDRILLKEGKLTDEEYDEIKKHTTVGAHILENSEMFDNLVPMVLHHHEKYDGRGYPDGLKAEEIPLMARIIAVADTFDAMTSKRTYRDPLSLDIVKAEIEKYSGTQFDPKVADAFLDILNNEYNKIEEIKKL